MKRPPVAAAEVRARRSGRRARRRAAPPSRGRPSPSSSRRGTDPSCATGSDCRPPKSRSRVRYERSSRPSRYSIACRTGEACGLTRHAVARVQVGDVQSAVISVTIDADDAWWPPTFSSSPLRPLAVRVVDDPDGEPQHAPLDRGERREVGLTRDRGGAHPRQIVGRGRDRVGETIRLAPRWLASVSPATTFALTRCGRSPSKVAGWSCRIALASGCGPRERWSSGSSASARTASRRASGSWSPRRSRPSRCASSSFGCCGAMPAVSASRIRTRSSERRCSCARMLSPRGTRGSGSSPWSCFSGSWRPVSCRTCLRVARWARAATWRRSRTSRCRWWARARPRSVGELLSGADALASAGLAPVVLEAKEGLALDQRHAVHDGDGRSSCSSAPSGWRMPRTSACALSLEALQRYPHAASWTGDRRSSSAPGSAAPARASWRAPRRLRDRRSHRYCDEGPGRLLAALRAAGARRQPRPPRATSRRTVGSSSTPPPTIRWSSSQEERDRLERQLPRPAGRVRARRARDRRGRAGEHQRAPHRAARQPCAVDGLPPFLARRRRAQLGLHDPAVRRGGARVARTRCSLTRRASTRSRRAPARRITSRWATPQVSSARRSLANAECVLAIELLAGAQAVEFLAPLAPSAGSGRGARPRAEPVGASSRGSAPRWRHGAGGGRDPRRPLVASSPACSADPRDDGAKRAVVSDTTASAATVEALCGDLSQRSRAARHGAERALVADRGAARGCCSTTSTPRSPSTPRSSSSTAAPGRAARDRTTRCARSCARCSAP